MDKKRVSLLVLTLLFTALVVYIPHYVNPFPIHVDEWHHITEALKIKNGEFNFSINAARVGFQFFLSIISYFADLVLIYKFFPALWSALSALALFFLVYKKTNNFNIGIFSIIFFASIKTNSNLLGLWFFTPLTFVTPLIFLLFYFYTEGIEKLNKEYLIYSLIITIIIIPTHSISFFFMIPILAIYSLIKYKNTIKMIKPLSSFLILIPISILFYSFITNKSIISVLTSSLSILLFRKGWGVTELNNSPLEIYTEIGYLFAIFGLILLISKKEYRDKCLIFLIWPLTLIFMIAFFRIFDFSYFSPYQRNMYYLALSLPFLSAISLNLLIEKLIKIKKGKLKTDYVKTILITLLLILIISFSFYQYILPITKQPVYRLIDQNDYDSIKYTQDLPKSIILAHPAISTTIYPIAQQETIATNYFYKKENINITISFLEDYDCSQKNQMINNFNISYVLSKEKINCNWELIYNKSNYIYKVK